MAAPQGIAVACDDSTFTASPTWVRLDQTYTVRRFSIDRGRTFETDRIGTGTATVDIIDRTGAFDPTNTGGAFYQRIEPLKQAAIAIQNPVDSSWNTLFRGFISSVEWEPYSTLAVANVRLELVDALALLAAAEMTPDGTWGNSVDRGNIVYSADTNTTAVQTRINKVLTEFGWPANSSGTDGVTNGTTTFTAASAAFATADVGKFITIQGKGRFQITARNSATSIEIDGTPSTASSLPWAYGMRSIFTGNVKLQQTKYPPRTQALSPILDAADAEFPFGVACFYVDKNGVVTFHGRLARFDPTAVDYHIDQWSVGDAVAVAAAPATVAPLVPPLRIYRDDASLYTDAIALPDDQSSLTPMTNAEIAGQYTSDATAVTTYGRRTWSAEGLVNFGGSGTTALVETKKFATYVKNNYKSPRTRVGQLTVKSQNPTGPSGSATWAMLCGIDLSDIVKITTTHGGGGGFSATEFFTEGIHYDVQPATGTYHDVTMTLDVSPKSYWATSPF